MVSDREEVLAVVARWEQAQAELATVSFTVLTATRSAHYSEAAGKGIPQPAGSRSQADSSAHLPWHADSARRQFLAQGAFRSAADLRGRGQPAHQAGRTLGATDCVSGETLPPALPNVAAAQARGDIGPEHVRIVEKFFDDLAGHIDYPTRQAAEADLARIATGLGPTQFRQAADRLALLLNEDGDLPDDAERARRRYLTIDRQGVDGMSRIHGLLDPEARATIDVVFAKLAAPGAFNHDDESPCVDGEPSEEAVQGDTRSQGQRNHDALNTIGRSVLASGELGKHNGLPATIIVVGLMH